MIFDPTMSKKKKKKKKPFILDEEGGETQAEETQLSETKEVEPEPTEDKDIEADEEDSRKKGIVKHFSWQFQNTASICVSSGQGLCMKTADHSEALVLIGLLGTAVTQICKSVISSFSFLSLSAVLL